MNVTIDLSNGIFFILRIFLFYGDFLSVNKIILFMSLFFVSTIFAEELIATNSDSVCYESSEFELREALIYRLNQEKPYTGESICIFLSNNLHSSVDISSIILDKSLKHINFRLWVDKFHLKFLFLSLKARYFTVFKWSHISYHHIHVSP